MLEAKLAAPLVRDYLAGKRRDEENPFREHEIACEKGIDNLEDMIDLFREQPFAFATFVLSSLSGTNDQRLRWSNLRIGAAAVPGHPRFPQNAETHA